MSALELTAKDGGSRLVLAIGAGPVIALGNILGNATADAVLLQSLAHLNVALDAVDLKLDAKNGSVEGEEQDAVEEKDPCGKEAELLQTALDARGGAQNENTSLDGVVLDNVKALLLDRKLNGRLDVVGRIGLLGSLARLLGLAAVVNRMRQNSASQNNVLLKTNGNDQEGQTLREQNHGNGNSELGGDMETEEEREDGREDDAGSEPEVGSHAAHREEERNEGEVHRDVAQGHDDDIKGLSVPEEISELNPGVLNPLHDAAASLDAGSLHDPHLLLVSALGLDGLLRGDGIRDFLGVCQELGSLAVREGEGERAVLGVGKGDGGRGQGRNREVRGNGNGVHLGGSGAGLGRIGEDEGEQGEMVGIRRNRSFGVLILPVPLRIGTGAKHPTARLERLPVGLSDGSGDIEEAVLQEADIGGAGEQSDENDGVNWVARSNLGEFLERRSDLLVDPRRGGGLGGRLLPSESRGEKARGDHVDRCLEGIGSDHRDPTDIERGRECEDMESRTKPASVIMIERLYAQEAQTVIIRPSWRSSRACHKERTTPSVGCRISQRTTQFCLGLW